MLLGLLPASGARAAPDGASAAAQARFRDGREAMKRGDCQRAVELFEESQRLFSAPGTSLNLAICEEKLGRLSAAREHFAAALAAFSKQDERATLASERLAALDRRMPRLRIQLARTAPPAAEVALDGAAVDRARLGTDVQLDPGAHVVVVSAPDAPDRQYKVQLAEGARSTLAVEPAPPAAASPSAAAPPSDARAAREAPGGAQAPAGALGGQRIAALVVGGAGVIGIGVGSVAGVKALQKKSELDSVCPHPAACTPAGVDEAATGRKLSRVSTAAIAAGLAGVGAGVALWLTYRSPARTDITARVTALPGGGAIELHGGF